jgi:ectonucleoside triphosphate diphosphohydrolase 5/6
MTKYRPISPFLCMDMTYITCLLKEGFGFKDNTVLQVRQSGTGHWAHREGTGTKRLIGQLNMMVYFVCFFSCSVPQLAKKVNNVETSWALGATFDHFNNLNIH